MPELAGELGLHERPTDLLVTACAALGLLERDGAGYRASPMAERYLVRGGSDYFGGWLDMVNRHDYPGWLRLDEALRTNRPTAWDSQRQSSLFDGADPVMLETFWEAMAVNGPARLGRPGLPPQPGGGPPAALPPGGRLLISDLLVADSKDGPLDAALMSLAMLVETFGRNYTATEYRDWLLDPGFVDVEVRPSPPRVPMPWSSPGSRNRRAHQTPAPRRRTPRRGEQCRLGIVSK